MRGAYLLCLLVSWAGVLTIDLRWRLALGQRSARGRRTSFAVVALGVAFFLAWDLLAIGAGFYGRGDSGALLGVWVVDHLPLEEIVFVAFLCHVTLVVAAAVARVPALASALPPARVRPQVPGPQPPGPGASGASDGHDERGAQQRVAGEVRR
ncbi:lycopene cyclase domain-containing protein [Cellulomonas sp. DKR-3]|uniref:Lycopene cyclase domain-containing protein n=1 Tax=Cellulomonas fulva TaxID=2835530 RepID=A0ABS5U0S6_9CELL|nr:lycopene cyclase domain-containing protein [Cellulomonas fulva]MBT0994956.1 lycopene cyclase domain-containing protein [Cellulomonas fulva]